MNLDQIFLEQAKEEVHRPYYPKIKGKNKTFTASVVKRYSGGRAGAGNREKGEKMKKVMMGVIVATVLCIACQSFSDAVNWYSISVNLAGTNGAPPDIFGPDGNVVPQTADWAARILTVAGSNEVYSTTLGGSQWSDAGVDGVFFVGFSYDSTVGLYNGQAIFTRIYDNADWTLATNAADVGFTTLNWPSATGNNPPNEYFYNFGTVSQGQWGVVPEPTTFLLFGIGGIGAWILRRKQA